MRELASIANMDLPAWMPYVGESAFAHKAGMHAAAVLKTPRSFEQVDPYLVGNVRRFPASEMSGRAVVLEKIKHIFPHVGVDSQEARALLQELKELESRGYQFEGADASFQLLVRKRLKPFTPFFELLYYHIYTDYSDGSDRGASATVKVRVGGQIQLMAAEGNGPVNALDQALRKALEIFYPVLSQVKLTDYKVRVLDSKSATAAGVRVLITSTDGEDTFTTVGVSGDVVAASWKASGGLDGIPSPKGRRPAGAGPGKTRRETPVKRRRLGAFFCCVPPAGLSVKSLKKPVPAPNIFCVGIAFSGGTLYNGKHIKRRGPGVFPRLVSAW